MCVFASECRKFCRPSKECVQGKGRKKECVRKERDNGRNVFGKGHRKGCVPFLMRVGTCKGTEGKVFANMSAGIDKKANTLWGGGALQVCDLRLAEDGGECSGALVSNAIELETARDGWGQ